MLESVVDLGVELVVTPPNDPNARIINKKSCFCLTFHKEKCCACPTVGHKFLSGSTVYTTVVLHHYQCYGFEVIWPNYTETVNSELWLTRLFNIFFSKWNCFLKMFVQWHIICGVIFSINKTETLLSACRLVCVS